MSDDLVPASTRTNRDLILGSLKQNLLETAGEGPPDDDVYIGMTRVHIDGATSGRASYAVSGEDDLFFDNLNGTILHVNWGRRAYEGTYSSDNKDTIVCGTNSGEIGYPNEKGREKYGIDGDCKSCEFEGCKKRAYVFAIIDELDDHGVVMVDLPSSSRYSMAKYIGRLKSNGRYPFEVKTNFGLNKFKGKVRDFWQCDPVIISEHDQQDVMLYVERLNAIEDSITRKPNFERREEDGDKPFEVEAESEGEWDD